MKIYFSSSFVTSFICVTSIFYIDFEVSDIIKQMNNDDTRKYEKLYNDLISPISKLISVIFIFDLTYFLYQKFEFKGLFYLELFFSLMIKLLSACFNIFFILKSMTEINFLLKSEINFIEDLTNIKTIFKLLLITHYIVVISFIIFCILKLMKTG
jgi:hypothetical protein